MNFLLDNGAQAREGEGGSGGWDNVPTFVWLPLPIVIIPSSSQPLAVLEHSMVLALCPNQIT